jgi:NADH-quinone oxidoreductase subunit N
MNSAATLADLLAVTPLIALFVASLLPITLKVLRKNQEPNPMAVLWIGVGGCLAAALLSVTVYLVMRSAEVPTAFSGALILDGKTAIVSVLALLVGFFSIILMYDNPATRGEQFSELIFLTLSSLAGMLTLASANDLVVVFLGLEMMSLSLYLMIAMSHEERLSKEAALKYFVLGGLASAIFLYGVSFIFGSAGSTSIPKIVEATPALIQGNALYVLGLSMALIGFCFKVSIVPFHAWTADVYQGAPTPLSAFMATAVKAVSFVAFLRLVDTSAFVWSESMADFFQWLAVITMTVGNVAAILQNNFKRMLAFSSIAHSGYLLAGLIAAGMNDPKLTTDGFDPSLFGTSAVFFYLIGYSVMTMGAFALVTFFERQENTSVSIDDLAGYAKQKPWMALGLTICLLSLAGVPPTLGFFGKFYLFTSTMAEGLLWLTLWGLLNSVISVYYYLRPIIVMYMKDGEAAETLEDIGGSRFILLTCSLLIVVLGVASGPLFELLEKTLRL